MDSSKIAELQENEQKWYELVVSHKTVLDDFHEKIKNGQPYSYEEFEQFKCELNQYELELEKYEPLLKENTQRFVIFPIHYNEIWAHYKRHMASLWTAEEITLADDVMQWRQGDKVKLSINDKYFITSVLAFFASFDGIVNENLAARFLKEVQIPEVRCFYGFQIAMENIHGEVYSLLIDTLVSDPVEKNKLFKAVENYPSIRKLSNWVFKWLNSDRPFNQRLIAFACVEGILFSGPFCSIFWLKKRGLLPGLTFSNELISRDESLHMEFACLLHSLLKYPAHPLIIEQIIMEAVEIEKEFISESLPCNLIGMNSPEMGKYIEFVADRLLVLLRCNKLWNTNNPFPWMDLISTPILTNFFERRVGEYNKAKFSQSTINSQSQHNQSNNITLMDEF